MPAAPLPLKTRALNLVRRAFLAEGAERALLRVTRGARAEGLRYRLPPNWYQYPPGTLRVARRHGFEFELDLSDAVPWFTYFGFVERAHETLVSLCRPGDVVFDVGANIGVTALRLAHAAGPAGRVFAFEPDPANFARLRAHAERNGAATLTPLRLALGDAPGELFLRVPDPNNRGKNHLEPDPSSGGQGSMVEVTTVDAFAAVRGLGRVDLVKLDVEGYEPQVLEGAAQTLRAHRPRLFIEFSGALLERAGRSAPEFARHLRSLGYRLSLAKGGPMPSDEALAGAHVDVVALPAP